MTLHVKDTGGVFREITDLQVRDAAGTLREIQEGWVRDAAGTLRQFYRRLLVEVAPLKIISKSVPIGLCYAGVQVDADGDLYEVGDALAQLTQYETWLDAGLNSQVWVLASPVSGIWSGDTLSTRLACTSDRKWTINNGGSGSASGELDLQFYDAATGGNLLDVQTVSAFASDI